MRMYRLVLAASLLTIAPLAGAAEFANASRAYVIDVPDQWRMVSPDFMITSPSGASIVEADLPPAGQRTLQKISQNAGMIACIGADYSATDEHFEVAGDQWNGLVTVFQEPPRYNRPPRHVLQLVVQTGQSYRLFYYALPSREWLSGHDSALKILRSLKFHTS
jgi:hypothetical protein